MAEPLVSVNMITYNHAPYIAEAIEGVLMQKCSFPFELLIGEDCSTDATREIARRYEARYPDIVRVITSDSNVGARQNSYRILNASRGKYIAHCEGDDYWIDPLKLQKQIDFLESHPDYGLVFGDVQFLFDATGVITPHAFRRLRLWEKTPEDLCLAILVDEYPMISGMTCTVCTRRDLVQRIKADNPLEFQTNRFLLGDRPLWLELSRLSRFKYMDEELATYRIQYESTSKSQSPAKILRFRMSCKDLNVHYRAKFGYPEAVHKQIVETYNRVLLWFAFLAGDRACARDIMRENRELQVQRTLRDWCLYLGAESRYIGPVASFAMRHLGRARNRGKRWASRRPWCLRIYRWFTGRTPVLKTTEVPARPGPTPSN